MDEQKTQELQDLLQTLAVALVDNCDAIEITSSNEDETIVLNLRVAPEDMGRVIGKGGKRAQAIRSILKAKASRLNCRVSVNIVD